jgi:hypothetical protein
MTARLLTARPPVLLVETSRHEEGSGGLETIMIEVATPELGRVLYSALSAFHPELDTDADGKCIVSVRSSSETQMRKITQAVQLHLADEGDRPLTSVSYGVGNYKHSRRLRQRQAPPRPRLTLIVGGHALPDEVDPWKTYGVKLVLLDGTTSTTSVYASPTGQLPRVDDVIPVDEGGSRARVTAVSRSDHPPIRAYLLS